MITYIVVGHRKAALCSVATSEFHYVMIFLLCCPWSITDRDVLAKELKGESAVHIRSFVVL